MTSPTLRIIVVAHNVSQRIGRITALSHRKNNDFTVRGSTCNVLRMRLTVFFFGLVNAHQPTPCAENRRTIGGLVSSALDPSEALDL